ncbi:MAG TPA: GvpL/GvpF family gas vesicle protein [Vicinamibacterales bacterium]
MTAAVGRRVEARGKVEANTETESACYVFCIVECSAQPPLPDGLPRLPMGGVPRTLVLARGLWLAVADVPLKEYSKSAIERCLQDLDCVSMRAVAHEATIAAFFRRGAVIPLKLFTIFETEERALAHVRRRLDQVRRLFSNVRHREEWGIRLTIQPGELPAPPPVHIVGSGRDYLEAKKIRRRHVRAAAGVAHKEARRALSSLSKLAERTRRHKSIGADAQAVLQAAFLVSSRRSTAWKAHARTLGLQLAKRGCRIEITGPWPPYNFVSRRT